MCNRWTSGVALVLILVAGLFLRMATLERQSLWFDEAHWVCKMVESPSLGAWLLQSDDANRDMVPFYFILEYLWYHHVVPSTLGMRWLSVFIGLLAVFLTYRFGRELYGAAVGLLAALCCSLSPLQIEFSQELRPYGLMCVLGLVSAYAMRAALYRGGKRWWAINIIANSLLMWTHLFGLWLIATEGLFLLFFHARPFWLLMAWGFVNAVLMVPVAMLAMTWSHPGDPPLVPHWTEIVSTWLCIDSYYLALLVYYRTVSVPQDLFVHLPRILLSIFPAIVATSSALMLGGACYQLKRHRRDTAATPRASLFLWMLFALPALWILLFSELIVPAFQLRYAIYSAPALYILAAAGVLAVRRTWLRYGLVATLAASLGAAGFIEMELPIRPDYKGAARYVQNEFKSGEKVFWQPAMTCDTFLFNLDPAAPQIAASGQSRIRDELAGIDASLAQEQSMWVLHAIWEGEHARAVQKVLEEFLVLRRIEYVKRVFPGRWDVAVYHCARSPEYRPLEEADEIARLHKAVSNDPSHIPLRALMREALEKTGRHAEAADLCRDELNAVPTTATERAALDTVLWRLGWIEQYVENGDCADDYIYDLISGLCGDWLAIGQTAVAVQEMDGYAKRFPDNKAVTAACAYFHKVFEHTHRP